MSLLKWLILFLYECTLSLIFSIVAYYRSKESYERKEKIFKPFREFLAKFGIKLKSKSYDEYKPKKQKTFLAQLNSLIVLILLILLARYSILEPYKIPTGSMIPTLQVGDFLFVNKLAYGLRLPFIGEVKQWAKPKRGDIVTFYPPISDDKMYVKRLVGLPGDHIQVDDTKLYINGQEIIKTPIPFYPTMQDTEQPQPGHGIEYNDYNYTLYKEDLLGIKHYALQIAHRDWLYRKFSLDIKIPDNYYFFMGDNRDNSEDSRVWGLVPRDRIRGRVAMIWLSVNWSKLFTKDFIRWNRFFLMPNP